VGYNCVVLVKQVPDTKRITGKVMNDDGTVNRAALAAIFNPEDLNALEMALQIKGLYGGTVTAITMGLPSAAEVLREALYRGSDRAILITDPRAAASDTLATSYILSCAVRNVPYDIVLCGRQAIDGDTAQVGPQVAQKLGITQITYVEALEGLQGRSITVRRNIGNGWQLVRTNLPVLMTVIDSANQPRIPAAKRLMRYKKARARCEIEAQLRLERPQLEQGELAELVEQAAKELSSRGLLIEQWDIDMIGADPALCGRSGSPTKVHRIQSVILSAKDSKTVEPTDAGISQMISELISDRIIA
jgi:electron transfer flavoprotein beta subunit